MPALPFTVHPGDGPPALLVHGFLSSPAQWQDNLAALSTRVTPVTVSLWGHAGAPHPGEAAYPPDAYVAALDAVRQALGAPRVVLVGYSLGAALTLRYALDHPERVLAHVFTNSTSALADEDQQRRWRDDAPAAAARILEGGRKALTRIPVHPRFARNLPPHLYQALMDDAERHDPAGIAATLTHTTPAASVRHRIDANVRPALLVCGRRETRFLPLRDFAAARMPGLTVRDVDGGHAMTMDAAATFNAAVGEFLDACATSSTS